jgi:hypothetical protein
LRAKAPLYIGGLINSLYVELNHGTCQNNTKVRRAFCNLLNITYYITRMKKSKGKNLTLYPGDLWELGSTVHGKLDNLKCPAIILPLPLYNLSFLT